ncbi:MAG: hypothetical protein ACKVJG_20885 [Candidatus Latescibacterota bacterium]
MSKLVNDGLSRLQNQSRIPASRWRQWCNLLKLDPIDAVDVWEEICHPIMLATREVPEVPYILQMRASRLELDIFYFREEVPKILHLVAFIYSLKDERLTKGKVKSALLKFYRKAALNCPPGMHQSAFVEQFIMDLCSVILVAKVLLAVTISLAVVMKPVIEGRGSLDQILHLGLKSLGDKPYAKIVQECLDERRKYVNRDAESDDGEGEDDEEEEEDEYGDDTGAMDAFLIKFKTSLHQIYEIESEVECDLEEDEERIENIEVLLDERLKAITLFKPLQATIPSVEEAQVIARRDEAKRTPVRVHKPIMGGGGGSSLTGADGSAMTVKSGGQSGGKPSSKMGKPEVANKAGSNAGSANHGVDVAPADMVELEEVNYPAIVRESAGNF